MTLVVNGGTRMGRIIVKEEELLNIFLFIYYFDSMVIVIESKRYKKYVHQYSLGVTQLQFNMCLPTFFLDSGEYKSGYHQPVSCRASNTDILSNSLTIANLPTNHPCKPKAVRTYS